MSITYRPSNQANQTRRATRVYATVPEPPPSHYWHGCKSYWSITTPLGRNATNLLYNPSFETDTDGWGVVDPGDAVTLSTATAVHGSRSALVTTTAGPYSLVYGKNQGFVSPHPLLTVPIGQQVSACVWVKANRGDEIQLQLFHESAFPGTNLTITNPTAKIAATGDWQQICTSFKAVYRSGPVITTIDLAMDVFNQNGSAANQMFVDHAIVAVGSTVQPFNGDTAGATWNGTPHRSFSTLNRFARGYGAKTNLTDLCFDVIGDEGHGMPPIENLTTSFATGDGARFQRTKRLPRVISIIGVMQGCNDPTELHECRQKLIDALGYKFEGQCNQELILTYQMIDDCCNEISSALEIPVLYQGGLEFTRNSLFSERIVLQFVANQNVYFRAIHDSSAALATNGAGVTVANDGNAPTYPTITMRAGAAALTINRIVNDTNQTAMALGVPTVGYTIPAGSYVILNTDPRSLTATLYPGGTDISGQINHEQSYAGQFKLTPGDNSMRIEGTAGAGAEVTAQWRAQYQSVDSVELYTNCGECN